MNDQSMYIYIDMLNQYSRLLQDSGNKDEISASQTIYSDLCAQRPSGSNMPQEIMEEIVIYEDQAKYLEPDVNLKEEKREEWDCFECTFCGEQFTLSELYRTHVIEEHYKKSVGTFWNQRCFQDNS